MAAAGYDPLAAVRYLQGLPADDAASLKAVNAAIEKLPARAYSANTGQFRSRQIPGAQPLKLLSLAPGRDMVCVYSC
jgi:hypothetical protein